MNMLEKRFVEMEGDVVVIQARRGTSWLMGLTHCCFYN